MLTQKQHQTMEMAGGLQRRSQEAMQCVLTHMKGEGKINTSVDGALGIPKPVMYECDQNQHSEWIAKLLACMRATAHTNMDQLIAGVGQKSQLIVEHDLDVSSVDGWEENQDFSRALHAQLVPSTTEHFFQLVHSGPGGNGLAALRVVMGRYEAWTVGAKRTILKAIITSPLLKRAEKVEELVIAGKPIDKYIRASRMIDLCVKYLNYPLELAHKFLT